MDLVKTSLEALLQRATNPLNENIDTAAIEAFCGLINKEKDGPYIGIKLLALHIHSKDLHEVLQTLIILDMSMQKCGTLFQAEVGKFRFLNEMIKLVSPKYLGSQTPVTVKQKVLQLMYLWTLDYPKEIKIKEAYDMLKKQGVIKAIPLSVSAENYCAPERKTSTLFQDEEKSKLLEKLLQSKNPEDLQAANRLIKNMVKEDEKKAEFKSRRMVELESVHNNVRLLNEMLDSYKPGYSSGDELDLIKELYQSCRRLRPYVGKLASETKLNEQILGDILHANDDLDQVMDKFASIIEEASSPVANNLTLLDFTGNSSSNVDLLQYSISVSNSKTDMDSLCDIFTSSNISNSINSPVSSENILKPITINKNLDLLLDGNGDNIDAERANSKLKALEDLDALGEHLLKENLQSTKRMGPQFNKIPDKIPMNLLAKQSSLLEIDTICLENRALTPDMLNKDLSELSLASDDMLTNRMEESMTDDVLVDITDDANSSIDAETTEDVKTEEEKNKSIMKQDLKLSDLLIDLTNIKPSNIEPIVAMDEKNGISVTLHFAKDKPRDDVCVIVVTIISKNELPLKNVLFRAIVPKVCKVKLQSPTASELPTYNPFLPPAAITQVMLIANPENVQVSLKFIVSYNIDDETTTEMGEIPSLPVFPL